MVKALWCDYIHSYKVKPTIGSYNYIYINKMIQQLRKFSTTKNNPFLNIRKSAGELKYFSLYDYKGK